MYVEIKQQYVYLVKINFNNIKTFNNHKFSLSQQTLFFILIFLKVVLEIRNIRSYMRVEINLLFMRLATFRNSLMHNDFRCKRNLSDARYINASTISKDHKLTGKAVLPKDICTEKILTSEFYSLGHLHTQALKLCYNSSMHICL